LHDLGLVPFEEPFPKIRLGGIIHYRGAKMSKSRGNVVGPDDYLGETGADVLRCALMFSAPWQVGGEFRDDAITGIERFFTRVWHAVLDAPRSSSVSGDGGVVDRSIAAVERAIERLRFNVGLARLMELTGWIEDHGAALSPHELARARGVLVLLLAPFAPHLAEELWSRLGGKFSVHTQPWPGYDAAALVADEVDLVVQIDGRTRDRVRVATEVDEADAVETALARPRVRAHLAGRTVTRTVFVPGRLLNLVTHRT
jgi:leucyl-tRNA synthetase